MTTATTVVISQKCKSEKKQQQQSAALSLSLSPLFIHTTKRVRSSHLYVSEKKREREDITYTVSRCVEEGNVREID
jgi:hypothetical protein